MGSKLRHIFARHSSPPVFTVYGENLPAWPEAAPLLSGIHTADAVVIGGGFTGLTTALKLAEAGKKVILCEAGKISDSPSCRSGGQAIPGFDLFMDNMDVKYGEEATKNVWQAEEDARARLLERILTETDACDMQPGIVAAAMTPKHMQAAIKTVDFLRRYGYREAELLDKKGIQEYVSAENYIGGFVCKDAFHINPEKYLRLLKKMVMAAGVAVHENSPVTGYTENSDGTYTVATPAGSVTAPNAVIACGADFHRPQGLHYDTLERTFVKSLTAIIVTEKLPETLLKKIVPGTAAWFDMRENMNYGRVVNGRIIFGGADALMQVRMSSAISLLKKEMYETFPELAKAGVKVEKYWTGPIDASKNLLPSIRRLKKGLYEASGFSGHGIVRAELAGEAISEDIVAGRSLLLEQVAAIAPEPLSRHALLAKLQIVKEHRKMLFEMASNMLGLQKASNKNEAAPAKGPQPGRP